jgi:hypothetical protein
MRNTNRQRDCFSASCRRRLAGVLHPGRNFVDTQKDGAFEERSLRVLARSPRHVNVGAEGFIRLGG